MAERTGIQLSDLYDGVAIWVEPDGSYTNRLAELYGPDSPRAMRVDEWIKSAMSADVPV